ncbi:MAG: dockerin type I domain-containing protein [Defluviitaleaceae bacterium]|nr:dockerin type I domain-containing protein [Defluviitaleaceae bacterium]
MRKIKILHLILATFILTLFTITSAAATTYEYDNFGRVKEVTLNNGNSIYYTYDEYDNIVSITAVQGDYVTVTFVLGDGVIVLSGELIQTIPQGGEAVAPIVSRKGWIFDEWDISIESVTTDINVLPIWLRLGNVSMDGRGNVTSADVVWLARHIAGHAGFDSPDERIADINGDGIVDASDITALMRWLVGYDLDDLKVQTEVE